MTLQRARELMAIQVALGGGYNRHAARVLLAEVQRSMGREAVDQLILEFDLGNVFGFRAGESFRF